MLHQLSEPVQHLISGRSKSVGCHKFRMLVSMACLTALSIAGCGDADSGDSVFKMTQELRGAARSMCEGRSDEEECESLSYQAIDGIRGSYTHVDEMPLAEREAAVTRLREELKRCDSEDLGPDAGMPPVYISKLVACVNKALYGKV